MAADERDRVQLRERLVDVLGGGPADTLMASLPVLEWSELATRQDVADLGERIDTQGRSLRTEMAGLATELRSEMAVLGSELRTEIAVVRSDLRPRCSTAGPS